MKEDVTNGTEINSRLYPFQGLAHFIAPLCLIFKDGHDLYLKVFSFGSY